MSFFIQYCILLKQDSLLPILRFPGYFETPLFRTFFHFPWDFEMAGSTVQYILIDSGSDLIIEGSKNKFEQETKMRDEGAGHTTERGSKLSVPLRQIHKY